MLKQYAIRLCLAAIALAGSAQAQQTPLANPPAQQPAPASTAGPFKEAAKEAAREANKEAQQGAPAIQQGVDQDQPAAAGAVPEGPVNDLAAARDAAAKDKAAAQAAMAAVKGSLVIIGGGLRGDNADVWQKIVNLAGGKGAKIAVFPSASGTPERSAQSIIEYLKKYGADPFAVPVAVRLAGSDYRKAADDAALAEKIRRAGGVYFAGGDQSRITQALVRSDGTRTLALEAVWDVYRKGGVVAGTSAGAAIMSSTMFYNPRAILAMLRAGVTEGKEIAPGLGFIGDDVFVDQHMLVRGRFARMIPAMLAKNYKLGLGVDEDSAMVINAKREVEVIGYTGAILIDLSHVVRDMTKPDFNASNVRISYLDRGDKFNLITQSFTPSPDKAGGQLDPARPALRGPVYSNDVLGNSAVVDIMERLIDSDQEEAIGVAFGNPRSSAPEVGFEFRFTKTDESVGYVSSVAEAYSVLNIRLDIRPIDIPRPMYKYR